MAKLNEVVQPDRKQINWLNSNFNNGHVYVDNSFQRRSVWVLKNKIRLIETIIKGFPMPEIYLWAGAADPATGSARYSVVDGQQRLTAIREYIAGAYKLDENALDEDPADPPYKNKLFNELADPLKQAIWEYIITTRMIPSSIERPEIVEMFLRLNETDKSLNPQELRNAEFNGLFIKNVEKIANLDFWTKYNVFTAASIRRMGDLQFISSLLMFLRSGINAEVSQDAINSMYDTYNDIYPQVDEDFEAAQAVIAIIDQIFSRSAPVAKFFKSQVHLYSLFIVIFQQRSLAHVIDPAVWAPKLEEFARLYVAVEQPAEIASYRAAATEGTQKRANREERVLRLKDWVTAA